MTLPPTSKGGSRAVANVLDAITQVKKAFGAPGDYGYGTPEGDALFALYRAWAELQQEVGE